ncbi:MAG: hypothetical protein AAF598_14485 [Bacteroidota bacterium]
MKLHIQTVITVLALLGLGFAMGMLTSGMLMKNRVKSLVEKQMPGGFERHMSEALDLTEAQKEQIQPFLEAHSKTVRSSMMEIRKRHRTSLDSLKTNITPFLDKQQKDQLDETFKQMQRKFRQKRKKDGPNNRPPKEK